MLTEAQLSTQVLARQAHQRRGHLASLTGRKAAGRSPTRSAGHDPRPPTAERPSTQAAGRRLAAQLGKPQWGATGPGSYDCSGLVQAAWASAGVSIPRTTYAQWAALPHISTSALEPGDLLYFDGVGHVAIYVGGGNIIDAPQTGQDVQKIPLAGWYKSTLVGAARP